MLRLSVPLSQQVDTRGAAKPGAGVPARVAVLDVGGLCLLLPRRCREDRRARLVNEPFDASAHAAAAAQQGAAHACVMCNLATSFPAFAAATGVRADRIADAFIVSTEHSTKTL